jgi:hypothetical protein
MSTAAVHTAVARSSSYAAAYALPRHSSASARLGGYPARCTARRSRRPPRAAARPGRHQLEMLPGPALVDIVQQSAGQVRGDVVRGDPANRGRPRQPRRRLRPRQPPSPRVARSSPRRWSAGRGRRRTARRTAGTRRRRGRRACAHSMTAAFPGAQPQIRSASGSPAQASGTTAVACGSRPIPDAPRAPACVPDRSVPRADRPTAPPWGHPEIRCRRLVPSTPAPVVLGPGGGQIGNRACPLTWAVTQRVSVNASAPGWPPKRP